MTRLERRLQKLELRLTDPSGLVPHSQSWLEYWDRQMYLHMTYQPRDASQFSVETIRAVMKYSDHPDSLFGEYCRKETSHSTRDDALPQSS